jgi:hypothetical protein
MECLLIVRLTGLHDLRPFTNFGRQRFLFAKARRVGNTATQISGRVNQSPCRVAAGKFVERWARTIMSGSSEDLIESILIRPFRVQNGKI